MAAIAAAILPLLVPMFTLQRSKQRIVAALQQALGRPVSAAAVRLRLLPWPGFELDEVQLGENPAFGIEPMASAAEVIATLRLAPLWRGRYEFSSVELDQPELNLARNPAGYWNFASLLDYAQQGLPAMQPSGAPGAWFRPAPFPYLKIRDGRINFKLGGTKTRFYLDQVQADLALQHGRWRFQASFAPQRNDMNLDAAGQVRMTGWWQAGSARFQSLPFQLRLHLRNAYLTSASALLLGHTGPLEGIAQADLQLQGNGRGFSITGMLQANELRRRDLLLNGFDLAMQVRAQYDPRQDRLEILSLAPVPSPGFQMQGVVQNVFTRPAPRLECRLKNMPVAPLVFWARAFKAGLPDDLEGSGQASGTIRASTGRKGLEWQGQARVKSFRLTASRLALAMPLARWRLTPGSLRLLPVRARLRTADGSVPLRLSARMDARGYQLKVAAPQWRRAAMEELARLWGIAPPYMGWIHGGGAARLRLAADWQDYQKPIWTGEIRLQRGRFRLPYATSSLHIAAGKLQYRRAKLQFSLDGKTAGMPFHLSWQRPRQAQQNVRFKLTVLQARRARLERYFRIPKGGWLRNWLRLRPQVLWPDYHAAGWVRIQALRWHGRRLSFETRIRMSATGWKLSGVRLRLAGGEVAGRSEWGDGGCVFQGRASGLQLAQLWPGFSLAGRLSGPLRVTWPHCRINGNWSAQGMALVQRLHLPAASLQPNLSGESEAKLVSASFFATPGEIRLARVMWLTNARNYSGAGSWQPKQGWAMKLAGGGRRLRLVLRPAMKTARSLAMENPAHAGGASAVKHPRTPIFKPKPPQAGKEHAR